MDVLEDTCQKTSDTFLTIKQIAFTDKKLWEPSYKIHRGNLHKSTFRLGEDDPNVGIPQTSYQMSFEDKLHHSDQFRLVPGRTLDSKQRKNKSLALHDLMTMDDPGCSSYPTYWTQYKMTHGKLGLALGTGQDRPIKQAPRYHILTGEELLRNEKENYHLISRSQILLQERQSEQEKYHFLLG